MNFVQMVSAYIGRLSEVMVTNQLLSGVLFSVTATDIQVQESPTVYTPVGALVTVPIRNVDYVRVLP